MTKLELVPIEGEQILSEEEKKRLMQRFRPIPPKVFRRLTEADRSDIKQFLTEFLVTSERIHHDKASRVRPELHEQHVAELEVQRTTLFQNPTPVVTKFIRLLELCPMVPQAEIDELIITLRQERLNQYDDVDNVDSGSETEIDNPFLKQHKHHTRAKHMEQEMKCRLTPDEIAELIVSFSVEELVQQLLSVRRVVSGNFWDTDYYDF